MAAKKAATETFEVFTNANPFANANPEAFKEGYEKLSQRISGFAEFNKASLEAMMAAAGALSRGVERAASENTAFMKGAYEDGVAAFKAAASSKSAQEIIDIQSDYVRTAVGKNMAQLTRMSEHWTATAKEASEPLTQRYGEFIELVQSYRP
ncbi:MAG: phasin family protein [Parvularculaceae bacterium]|nr:phasin family protein [Parvularculaceae bacterium]